MSDDWRHTCALLYKLGRCVYSRYKQTDDRRDLDWAIALGRLLLDFCHPSIPDRWLLLASLAASRSIRYDRWKYSLDLDRAIVLWRDAVGLCPRDHGGRPRLLYRLARSLATRFELTGKIDDIDEAIPPYRASLALVPEDHPDHPGLLYDLAVCLFTRYQQVGNADDLDQSIILSRAVLSFRPEGHPERASALSNLGNALCSRFEQNGNEDDLSEAVQLHRNALALRPEGHPGRSLCLNNLACSLQTRYEQGGSVHDMNEAIQLHRDALILRPEGHPNRSSSLHNLATSLQARYKQGGSVDDLNEAIRLFRDALSFFPEGHPNRSSSLNSLANSLRTRSEQGGGVDDLNEAIQLHRDALILLPEGHPNQSSSLSNLATSLHTRCERNGSIGDLNEAVQLDHDALTLLPERHPGQSSCLNNLATGLQRRFERNGSVEDLNEAVQLYRDALALPGGHPNWSLFLDNLATSLRRRYEQNGSVEDLNEAIRLHRDALSLFPEGHTDRSASLNNLAISLRTRYEQSGGVDDLIEAIRLHRGALALRPLGHPGRSASMSGLATTLYLLSQTSDDTRDFEECVQLLMGATRHTFSSTLSRLDAARRWAIYARTRDHNTTLDAYRVAMSLLQRSLTVLPNLSEWHEVLLSSKRRYRTLAVDAASYAVEKGDLVAAIELLEQGRGLLWSQMRGLRDPFDRLSAVDKGLADKLAVCCRRLETLMTSSDTGRGALGMSGDDAYKHGAPKRRHLRDEMLARVQQLTEEQEAIIKEIRLAPGFEDFLQAASFEQLRQVASEGPVIVLNHSEFRCDALIILSREVEPCVCVPLGGDWFSDALDLCNDLLPARYKGRVQSVEYDETLRRTMKVVWDRVVSKIIRKLDELGVPKGSRIWWCPTLFLSVLPFHAAGPYKDANGATKYLLDDYISSYTPTLTSLIAARTGIRIGSEKFLFVGDTKLSSTKKEFMNIRKRRFVWRRLLDEEASRDSVLKALRKAEWVHFACHGTLGEIPFESAFALPGGKLTLLDIARANLPNAEFAFLSACHTAEQPPSFSMDEALHLAAAVQFCGFRSVIGTMWKLLDRDGPILADVVYAYLMNDVEEGEIRFKGAAAAVRKAAIHLRESQKEWGDGGKEVDIMAERWVNLVHFGA